MKKILLFLLFVSFIPCPAFAGDLDDGISKYKDDSIDKYDEVGKTDQNIKYIVLEAKSKANVREKSAKRGALDDSSSSSSVSQGGDNNLNSVVMGAGSIIRGDVYIVDESKGDKTQIAK